MARTNDNQDSSIFLRGWEQIENPAARRMAKILRRMCGPLIDPSFPDYLGRAGKAYEDYRQWVRTRLRESYLLAQISSGTVTLPELHLEGSLSQRLMNALDKPRNLDQMAAHLAKHLSTYLGWTNGARKRNRWGLLFAPVGVLQFGLFIHYLCSPRSDKWLWATSSGLWVVFFTVGLYRHLASSDMQDEAKYMINCAELYRHILELHAQTFDPSAESTPPR
jgi:hypothetical protein